MDAFLARWRTLTRGQQIIIGGIAALVAYSVVMALTAGQLFSWPQLISKALILLFALPVHELAHAAVATALGDDTPRRQGRLTLNPLKHLDPMGALLILIAGFGWAKPVQWNPRNIRIDPRLGAVLIAVAGPLSNLVMAIISLWIAVTFYDSLGDVWVRALDGFAQINVLLAVFNMFPVPPLDGSHVLFAILPGDHWKLRQQLSQYGMIAIFAVSFIYPQIFRVPSDWVYTQILNVILR